MLLVDGGLALIVFALWLFCVLDVITTPDSACRNLPKFAWLLIVVLLPDIGSIAWLIAGRPWNVDGGRMATRTAARPMSPDDDEEFLASLRVRAEEQRRRAREAQHRDEPPAPEPPDRRG